MLAVLTVTDTTPLVVCALPLSKARAVRLRAPATAVQFTWYGDCVAVPMSVVPS